MNVTYEDFRTKAWDERLRLFNELAPAEKALLVATHMSRWLEAHRNQLSVEQVAVVEENIRFVRPDIFDPARKRSFSTELRDLERRTSALLSRDQMRAALTLHW